MAVRSLCRVFLSSSPSSQLSLWHSLLSDSADSHHNTGNDDSLRLRVRADAADAAAGAVLPRARRCLVLRRLVAGVLPRVIIAGLEQRRLEQRRLGLRDARPRRAVDNLDRRVWRLRGWRRIPHFKRHRRRPPLDAKVHCPAAGRRQGQHEVGSVFVGERLWRGGEVRTSRCSGGPSVAQAPAIATPRPFRARRPRRRGARGSSSCRGP